jgi:hypothetical protein
MKATREAEDRVNAKALFMLIENGNRIGIVM